MKREKEEYNSKFAKWYYAMYQENGGTIEEFDYVDYEREEIRHIMQPKKNTDAKYFNKADRISSCLDFWQWDKYEKNKILDLQKVNRCMNRAFCPNCKMLNVARFIHEFKKQFKQLSELYNFYMLTVTIPSVPADDIGEGLNSLIKTLSKDFTKLFRKFNNDIYTPSGKVSSQALSCRLIKISGGIRVLEVTYNNEAGFHPHYHCILLVPKGSVNPVDLEKNHRGKWSSKRQSFNMKSNIDIQISKAWTMIHYGISFRKWDKVDYDPAEKFIKINDEITDYKALECDFVELDEDGIYEVFKYTFKNSEITDYRIFKNLVYALENKRFRQGFGVLYNFKCDEEFEEGEEQALILEIEEEPEKLITKEISELLEEFRDYRKISRFSSVDVDVVKKLEN